VTLPRTSVYAQLRTTPRVFLFMAMLLGGAVSLGAKEVARWQYLDEAFDSEWGLGIAAAIAAVAVAISGITVGRMIDRRDPRPFIFVSFLLGALSNAMVGLLLLSGPIPAGWIVVASILDGATFGVGSIALLKVQAAFVNPGAEGAAEILNILRLGIGGVIGAVLGGLSPDPALTLLASAFLLVASTTGLWWVMRSVTLRPRARGRTGAIAALASLRRASALRGMVGIDLVLAFVIPTQAVNLVLIGVEAPQVASLSIASGMVGVLIGRLGLAVVGFRGNPRRLLTVAVVGLAVCQIAGSLALTDGWLIRQLFALPAIIIVGSILSTYAQGISASIIQQGVPEEHRGGLAAVLVVGRNALISTAALGGAALAVAWGPQAFLVVLALGLLAVLLGSRRFASVPS